MSNHQQRIKDYYNSTQFDYSFIWNWGLKTTPSLHFGYYDKKATKHEQAIFRVNEVLADWANVNEGTKVLDAGCGLGNTSLWLAQNRKAVVTGITLVQKQVDTAYQLAKKQNINGAEFKVADYLNTPFEDNCFDVVWICEALCHAQDKSLFYKEAFRVLKPGGRLVIAENLRPERPMSKEKEQFLHEIFDAWAIPDLDTLEEHQAHANKTGFINFQHKDVTKNVWVSYKNLRKIVKQLKPLATVLNTFRLVPKIRYNNYIQSGRQADAIEQDVFTYAHLLMVKP
jgi:ubiquinone/menaquinone biosynthesis C-methylase UbiE